MRKTKEDAEKTKQEIIDAGIRIFGKKWYITVSMEEIAQEAGVTRGAIYWHFKNKADLFKEIHYLVSEEINSTINESITYGVTIYERSFSIIKNIALKYSRSDRLKQMNRLIYMNQAVLEMEEFREWHTSYHKEKKEFFSDIFRQITGEDLDKSGNEILRLYYNAAIAYTQGLLDMIIFGEESETGSLSENDIVKLVEIFLEGLFRTDYFKNYKDRIIT